MSDQNKKEKFNERQFRYYRSLWEGFNHKYTNFNKLDANEDRNKIRQMGMDMQNYLNKTSTKDTYDAIYIPFTISQFDPSKIDD